MDRRPERDEWKQFGTDAAAGEQVVSETWRPLAAALRPNHGDDDELGSSTRQLETVYGQGEGAVGEAHRRRHRAHQWQSRATRRRAAGEVWLRERQGKAGSRHLVQPALEGS